MSKLKPIDVSTIIYARTQGSHYHLDRSCPMLEDGDFERLNYVAIKKSEIKKRHLLPCRCAYEGEEIE